MCRYSRESLSGSLEIQRIARPFSNFSFIESRFPQARPLRRILSEVRSHRGKTMVIEELDVADAEDLSEENEDLSKHLGRTVSSRVWRLGFFTEEIATEGELESLSDEHFLGYAIVKEDDEGGDSYTRARVYESVIRPSCRETHCIRGSQEWFCRVGAKRFGTIGYLYAQQNNATNACAHVACRTVAARFHRDGDMTYREMNAVAAVKTPNDGLTSTQMVRILESAGATCFVADYTNPKPNTTPPPFQKWLYGSIESGYPAIVCFATTGGNYHAVPIFGHTFNEDTWVPNAEQSYFRIGQGTAYMPSESWLSAYIAHDDNWGSNYCIPRNFLYAKHCCEKWPSGAQPCVVENECVACIIATLPKEASVNPIAAEVIGADYLFSILPQLEGVDASWRHRLDYYARKNLLVLRPVLIDGREYIRHLERVTDWDNNRIEQVSIDALKGQLDRKVWMVELSIPELFSANRRKVGEVIIRADILPRGHRDFGSFVLARVPGNFVVDMRGSANKPECTFISCGVRGHVPLFGCEDYAETNWPYCEGGCDV